MKHNAGKSIAGLLAPLTLACAVGSAQAAHKQFFFSVGGGLSKLDPDLSQTSLVLDDDKAGSGKISFGYDITDHWSFDVFYADLGKVEFTGGGDIGYQFIGASGMYYLPGSIPGFSWMLRGGVANLNTDSTVFERQDNDTQLFGGLGMEYQFSGGVSLRAEVEYFTEDAQLASISLVKRFDLPKPPPEPKVVVKEKPIVVPPPKIVQEPPKQDTDGDGVLDEQDQCPGTPKGLTVDERGCPHFIGVLEGVNFEYNSDRLTKKAMKILDDVAKKLIAYPNLKVVVVGHTDSTGSREYNQKLSLRRARAVARYLVSKGVDPDRLRYAGKGEDEPRASNATPQGRALNRRVELVPVKDQ